MDICAYPHQCVHLVMCSTEDKIIPFLHVEEKCKASQILGGWEVELLILVNKA